MSSSSQSLPSYLAIHAVHAPRATRVLAGILVVLILVVALALTITPWQQNVTGSGRVMAFSPEERQQNIEAPVDGRIARWHVVEGSSVKKGDPIVELTDNDPAIIERLTQERDQMTGTEVAAVRRVKTIEDRIRALEMSQKTGVSAAKARVQMSIDRIGAAQQSLEAAKAALMTARMQQERQSNLAKKGLTSTRNVELAELDYTQKVADVERATNSLNAAKSEKLSLDSELLRTDADAGSRIDEAWGAHASAESDVAKSRAEVTKVEVRLARQNTQRVMAPVDGKIFRVVARQNGELLKAGDPIAILVPNTTHDVVELWIDGNDVPLISEGRPVRLQFEGWPALQFAGWPSIAVGTFGGHVQLVDSTDNGAGKFRVLIKPDPNDEPWPTKTYLRQGVRANGWVLLNQVPLGFELWRQFNGFPPIISMAEPGSAKDASKDKK
ncbi:MAG: HlyD family efflux transporter periplasmic adaptor subunit [Acidobacteria bacterium]|nr:HlyD family efflux transporter periplasmic adaptor subunit [Acidobacteriota bacterium]